jgi:hypothetical protein
MVKRLLWTGLRGGIVALAAGRPRASPGCISMRVFCDEPPE